VYLTNGIEFADAELGVLCELLELLDGKIRNINLQIKQHKDPGIDGLGDKGEYFIGVGFVAMQQYLVETILFTGLEKSQAYKLAPIHSSKVSYANLINSCANWWKHEPEWWNNLEVPPNGERSFSHVTNITSSPSYQLSNVLASLCEANEFCLMSVIPHLIEWRGNVHKARKGNL
jgi:hypothetical protein